MSLAAAAAFLVNYRTTYHALVQRAHLAPGENLLVLGAAGGTHEQIVRSMAWGDRYLVIGFEGSGMPSIPLNLPLLQGCSIVGVFWGAHVRRERELHAAIDALNGRRSTGNIVIRVRLGER
jgi:NADPH:quinone reductase-like Zn-dependent oxidoreductase